MVTKNKIPGNWPAALDMADKIEEVVLTALKAPKGTKMTYKCALLAIGKLVGSEDQVFQSRRKR